MSEKNIERIEKKVDLLYKILLELQVDYVGHPYDQGYISRFMVELIPLFGLSGIKEDIETTQETMQELKNKLQTELNGLEKLYKSGNFLAKDGDKIKDKITDISSCLNQWDIVAGEWLLSPKRDVLNKQIHKRSLFVDLKKKLGLVENNAYISYERNCDGRTNRVNLIEKRDAFKKNLKVFIRKIRNLEKQITK